MANLDYKNNYRPDPVIVKVNITGDQIPATLFADEAQRAADACNVGKTGVNASTQLRRFYDELVMWHDKVFAKQSPEEQQLAFLAFLPYVQMLRAKVAYSKGRKLVNETFYRLFDNLIEQVSTPETLKRARLFMEAFLGYKKYFESK